MLGIVYPYNLIRRDGCGKSDGNSLIVQTGEYRREGKSGSLAYYNWFIYELALRLRESIAVVLIVTVVWAGVIWVIVRVIGITPIPPPRVPIETETGNEKTIMAEKTAMSVKVSKTPAAKASEMPAVKVPKTPAAKASEMPAAKAPETTPAVKTSAAIDRAHDAHPPRVRIFLAVCPIELITSFKTTL